MSKHTPKFPLPWKATRVLVMSGMCHAFVRAANDEIVCRVDVHGESPEAETRCKTNTARIAACVSACEGIEDPEDILRDMQHCQERVAGLLAALRFIIGQRPGSAHANKEGLRERLRNVFASARLAIDLEEKEGNQ